MKERPILMNGDMVRATLRGENPKTQTRRVVKLQPPEHTREVMTFHHPDPRTHYWAFGGASLMDWAQPCPYGEICDRLYVRETWQHSNYPLGPYESDCQVFYRADYLNDPHGPGGEKSPEGKYRDWRPSIHMPRAASRISLEVTGVRVERLQDISEDDARAEGCAPAWLDVDGDTVNAHGAPTYRQGFARLWRDINGSESWDANPWVWVVEFRRIESL